MKRTKTLAVAVAVIMLVAAISGAAYLWFFVSTDAGFGAGNAAKIDLEGTTSADVKFDKVLPGQDVDLGKATVKYDGNRYAILRVAITDDAAKPSAFLNADPTGHGDWDSAYTGDYDSTKSWAYNADRLKEIVIIAKATGTTVTYYENTLNNPGVLYALLSPKEDAGKNLTTKLSVKFTGKLGGDLLASRQFEQESIFTDFGAKFEVVQCTETAVNDIFGAQAVTDIVASGLEAIILGTDDAKDSWAYTA